MATLSVSSFLSGVRSEDGKSVLHNPFFNPFVDRVSAEQQVIHYRLPVIRYSSREGLYAITYICYRRRMVVHTLLRQNTDNSVCVLDEEGRAVEQYVDIYSLLDLVLNRHGTPPTPRTPSASPRGGDADPTP
jgi:hypothetical protein